MPLFRIDATFEDVAPIPPRFVREVICAVGLERFVGSRPPSATGLAYGDYALRKLNTHQLMPIRVDSRN